MPGSAARALRRRAAVQHTVRKVRGFVVERCAVMPEAWSFPRAEALPTYAFLVTDEVKARVRASGVEIIDLGLGNPDRPTPEPIVKQLHDAADIGRNHRYHPGRGLPALREAYCRWYARRHRAQFDPEREVIVTMGAKEGISHLCLAILDHGDIAIVPDPCYPIHKGAPLIAGAAVAPYRVRADLEPARAVAEAVERLRASGARPKLVIANYPHNPTGQIISRDQLRELVQVVRDSGAMLLHDLAYADLDFAARHAPSIFDCGLPVDEVKRFAVEVFSMSKSYTCRAGASRSWPVTSAWSPRSPPSEYMDYGTVMPLQHAAAWALDHGKAWFKKIEPLPNRANWLAQTAGGGFRTGQPTGQVLWTPAKNSYRSRGNPGKY